MQNDKYEWWELTTNSLVCLICATNIGSQNVTCVNPGGNTDRILCTQKSLIKNRLWYNVFFLSKTLSFWAHFTGEKKGNKEKEISSQILSEKHRMLHVHSVCLCHTSLQDAQRPLAFPLSTAQIHTSEGFKICVLDCLAHTPTRSQILVWMLRSHCWCMAEDCR